MRLLRWPDVLPDGMELFRLDFDPDASELESSSCLPLREQYQARRYLRRADRVRFTQARAALRRLLGERLDCRPAEVPLAQGPYGKPYLDTQGLRGPLFNVSHSGAHALIALADAASVGQLGVDIEQHRDALPIDAMLQFAFTAREEAEILSASDAGAAFYQRWVGKEALLKAVGVGVSEHLSRVGIRTGAGRRLLIECAVPGWADFEAIALAAPPGYAAALAWRKKDAT